MGSFLDEVRYALRQLRKSPAFAFTAVLTLALGIGANTAIFTVVQSLLLKPLEYPEADRIIALNTLWEHKAHIIPRMTGPDLVDIRDQAKSIEAIGFYEGGELGVQLRDHATFVGVSSVNSGFAQVFQIQPLVGRWFTDAESKHAAVVNATFARNNFGSAQAAVGQIVKVEGQPLEIVGVVPGSFEFPDPHPGMDGLSGTAGVDFADRIQLSRRSTAAAWGSTRNSSGGAGRNRKAVASGLSQRQRGQELQVRSAAGAACRRSAADAAAVDVLGRAGAFDCLRQRNPPLSGAGRGASARVGGADGARFVAAPAGTDGGTGEPGALGRRCVAGHRASLSRL